MSLLEQIKSDSLEARKLKSPLASALITLYSEAAMVGKNNGSRDSTDAEVQAVVKKFLKGVDENLRIPDRDVAYYEKLQYEKLQYESYLPKQLTEAEIRAKIAESGIELTQRNTGQVMKLLAGQADGKLVSEIMKGA